MPIKGETPMPNTSAPLFIPRISVISIHLAFLFLMFLPMQSVAQPQTQKSNQEASALILEARTLWEKGEQWRAIDNMKKALAVDPGDAIAHTELADMYLAVKDNDSAREAINKALKLNPNYARAHHRKAVLLRQAGDFQGSIAEAKTALTLNPDDEVAAYSHVTMGRALVKLKNFKEADSEFRKGVSVYEENVKRKPDEASSHAALGDLLFELDDYDKAENSYRRALELDPKDPGVALNLARAFDNQGKKDEAIRYYQEYFRLNPAADKSNIEVRIKWLEANPISTVVSYLLIDAAENGKVAIVRSLIAKGANVNFRNTYKTPLYCAAEGGYLEVVRVLLDHSAKDEDGYALTAAYEQGHTEIEKLLDAATPKPLTPKTINRILFAALRRSDPTRFATLVDRASQAERDELLLYSVSQVKEPNVELVRMLLDKGANVNQPTRYKTPLMQAAEQGQAEIVSLLLDKGAQVNVQTDEGTALMMAVTGGNAATVKVLLAAGADVKAKHRIGDQTLIMSARRRVADVKLPGGPEAGYEIMEMLLAKGADVNASGDWNRTALMFANTPAKVDLLVRSGADLEAKDEYGETALMHAAERGDAAVVRSLLDRGADVNAIDKKGDNSLLTSIDSENLRTDEKGRVLQSRLEVTRRLLQAKGLKVDAQNLDGETALMRAVRLENSEMVSALLSKGADANRTDVFGDTAVTIAYQKANNELEKLMPRPSLKGLPTNVLNAFLRAAVERKDEAFVRDLLQEGADPNHEYSIGYAHKSINRTVLVSAALMGNAPIVQLLLNKGANVNAKGLISGSESGLKYGTALEAAEESKNTEVAAILRKVMSTQPGRQ
jgi:ankyrin repeat protein/Tfp pilus assembly protein PilF